MHVYSDDAELNRRIRRGIRQGMAVLWALRLAIWIVIIAGAVFVSIMVTETFCTGCTSLSAAFIAGLVVWAAATIMRYVASGSRDDD
jgi:hypothetical protein